MPLVYSWILANMFCMLLVYFGYFLIPYAHIGYLPNLIWHLFLFNFIPWAAGNEREWSYAKSEILVVSACNWI